MGRPDRRRSNPGRSQPLGILESLEGRVLLSADAEPAAAARMIDGLKLLPIPPAAVEFGGMTTEAAGSASGPRAPLGIGFASVNELNFGTAVAVVPLSNRTSSLLVQDDAGNALSSASEPDAMPLNAPITTGPAREEAGVEFAVGEGYGPQPEVGPPSPKELAATPRMPWTNSYSYTGSIDGMHSIALRIPVGPFTRTLTLGLTPQVEGEPFMPRIDQVFLIGRGGEELSRITGVSILGDGASQTLYISIQGAPMGGEIVVRLVSMAAFSPGDSDGQDAEGPAGGDDTIGGGGEVSPWDGTSFELSILRNEARSQGGGPSVTTAFDDGAPYVVMPGRIDVPTAIGPLAPTAEATATTDAESVSASRVAVPTTLEAADIDVDLADEGAVVVYLGPLVSRTAAALGPVLATTSEEPTPSAGRGPRSQGGGLAAFGAESDLELILAVKARGDRGGPADANPALTTLRGPGGVPIVVAGLGVGEGDRSRDADDLAASAVGAAQEEAPLLADVLGAEAVEGEVEVARAGLATRALGFLIGMGLASGPLYPDLIALARRKFRRRNRPAKTRRTVAG